MMHTPGPWQAKDDDEVWAGEVHIADCMLYAYDDYFLTHYDMPGTNEDNATLLAAAPNLLAACKEASYYFHCMTKAERELVEDMMGDPPPVDVLDAAIAKAEPKESPDA